MCVPGPVTGAALEQHEGQPLGSLPCNFFNESQNSLLSAFEYRHSTSWHLSFLHSHIQNSLLFNMEEGWGFCRAFKIEDGYERKIIWFFEIQES